MTGSYEGRMFERQTYERVGLVAHAFGLPRDDNPYVRAAESRWVRGAALVAALLFTVVALQIFSGRALTPLSQPLPFFAYPFLAATLFGWAWTHYRNA